jgi:hypothetical protein
MIQIIMQRYFITVETIDRERQERRDERERRANEDFEKRAKALEDWK